MAKILIGSVIIVTITIGAVKAMELTGFPPTCQGPVMVLVMGATAALYYELVLSKEEDDGEYYG
jgi:hypothetical protein